MHQLFILLPRAGLFLQPRSPRGALDRPDTSTLTADMAIVTISLAVAASAAVLYLL